MKYPVVKLECFFLSFFPMPAPLLYTEIGVGGIGDGSQRVEQGQQGLVLTDEGLRGQQEEGGESRLFPFGTPDGAT